MYHSFSLPLSFSLSYARSLFLDCIFPITRKKKKRKTRMGRFTKILILVLRVSFSLRVINHLTILIERSKLSWRIVEIAHKRDLQFG